MNQLEPTYLRYVYDGLSKGSISSNNPTSLPIGFIGLFEDEFPSNMPLVERMSILNRLAIWALLKGPVSIEMVAGVLNEHPDNTKALVDTYSKWFNSPEPGKYVLYHDRLRAYLLQKLSDHEVQDLNEKLIRYLENVLNSEGLNEAESYALEHLSTHMLIESQMDSDYERLHEFVNHEDLWKRQITISNEYKWSQRAVQFGIKEGARRHHEMNTLSSTVNSIKLQREEQNNIKQILNILSTGDYQTAISRALSFSREKIMTVYLLMIHEVIIDESIQDDYKFEVCKSILKSIKESQPEKVKYPILALYTYHVEFFKIKLDDKIIWDIILTNSHGYIDTKKIKELLYYKDIDLNVILRLTQRSTNSFQELIPIYINIVLIYETRYKKYNSKKDLFNGLNLLAETVNFLLKIDIYSWSEMSSLEINNQSFYNLSDAYIYIIDYMLDYTYQYNLDIPLREAKILKLQDLLFNLFLFEYDKSKTSDTKISKFGEKNTESIEFCEIKMLSIYERFDNHKEIKRILNELSVESLSVLRLFKESIISIAKFYIFRGDYDTYKKYLSYIDKANQISIHLELSMLMLGIDLSLFPYLLHITPSSSLHSIKKPVKVLDKFRTKEVRDIALSVKNDLDILDAKATSDEIYKRQDSWIRLYIIFSELRDFENANYSIENSYRYNNKNISLKTIDIMKCATSYFIYGQIDKCNEFISYALDLIKTSNLTSEKHLIFKALRGRLRSVGRLDLLVKLYYEDCKGDSLPLGLLLKDWTVYTGNNISSFFYYLNSKIKGVELLINQFKDAFNESSTSVPITAFLPYLKEIEFQNSDINILNGLDQLNKLMNELLTVDYIFENLDVFLTEVHLNGKYSPLLFDNNKNCFLVNDEFVVKPDCMQINLYIERLRNYINQLDKNMISLIKAANVLELKRSINEFEQFNSSDQIYWSSIELKNKEIKASISECLKNKVMSFEDISNKIFFGEKCLKYFLKQMLDSNEIRINSQDQYFISGTNTEDPNQKHLQSKLQKLNSSEINNLTKDKKIDYYTNIISYLDYSNDKDEILVLLNDCWDIVRSIDDSKHITSQLVDVSLNYTNLGEFEKAKILINKIDDKSHIDSFAKAEGFYEIGLIILEKFDQKNLAIDFLKESFALALKTELLQDERFNLYSEIICKLLDLQENKLAYELAISGATNVPDMSDNDLQFLKVSHIPNEFFYDSCYDAYFRIAFKFIDCNKEEDALKVIDSIKNQQKGLEFRLSYTERLIKQGDKVKALEIINEVISSGESLDDMNLSSSYDPINDTLSLLKAPFIIHLVKVFILMNKNPLFENNSPNYFNKINSYLDEALISVLNCEDDQFSSREYCLKRIAELFLEINHIEEAKSILENNIGNKTIRSNLLISVIEKMLELNKYNEAFDYARDNNLNDYSCFNKFISFKDILKFSKFFKSNNLVEAISKNFNDRITEPYEEFMYLSNLYNYTDNLQDILLYKAKMECFFEEKKNENKLDLIEQVIDIKEWRELSFEIM